MFQFLRQTLANTQKQPTTFVVDLWQFAFASKDDVSHFSWCGLIWATSHRKCQKLLFVDSKDLEEISNWYFSFCER